MRGSIPGPQDHDLSGRQTLNRLSHPDALNLTSCMHEVHLVGGSVEGGSAPQSHLGIQVDGDPAPAPSTFVFQGHPGFHQLEPGGQHMGSLAEAPPGSTVPHSSHSVD